ncbi:MAG: hypothetical protein K2Z81_21325, partial [Cyanobacteria bacterium]|nr:hypothetical protein [Cyanobacteriota bacterium]
ILMQPRSGVEFRATRLLRFNVGRSPFMSSSSNWTQPLDVTTHEYFVEVPSGNSLCRGRRVATPSSVSLK